MVLTNTKMGIGLLLTLLIGILLGRLTSQPHTRDLLEQLSQAGPRREHNNQYTFINPLLTCLYPESVEFEEYSTLENTIQTQMTLLEQKGQIDKMSYYFRNLYDGRWVGINETEDFAPASLFKVPTLMAYYKAAEKNPEVLTKQITYTKDMQTSGLIDSPVIELGDAYAVETLLDLMITESDNVAMSMLMSQLDYVVLRELFVDLGIPYPGDPTDGVYKISPRQYSLFFRVLYNGTYLNHEYSERALKLLSEATFDKGLTAGLPEGIAVSHKFGERELYTDSGQSLGYELHDCGIVYDSSNHYFLCVFTSGEDIDALADAIRQVSELTYASTQNFIANDD